MAKDAFYFSHDSNAYRDKNILKMRMKWDWQGYGLFWAIVERLRDSENYTYKIEDIPVLQFDLNFEKLQEFIDDCINNFELFKSDGKSFWSESLKRRMERMDEKRFKAKQSADYRWQMNNKNNADAMQSQSESNAIKENKIKENKSKANEIKENVFKFKSNQDERLDLQYFGKKFPDLHHELTDIPIEKPVSEIVWRAASVLKRKSKCLIGSEPLMVALERAIEIHKAEQWFVENGGIYWLLDVKHDGKDCETNIAMKCKKGRDAPNKAVTQNNNFGDGQPFHVEKF